MKMPGLLPPRLSLADHPAYALASLDRMDAAQFFGGIGDWGKRAKCAGACSRKAGFVACMARCLVTGEACDGGLDNCSGT